MSRAIFYDEEKMVVGNRMSNLMPPQSTHCLADKCMAWVWLAGQNGKTESKRGYCGLLNL
jgi:hypothetical protein